MSQYTVTDASIQIAHELVYGYTNGHCVLGDDSVLARSAFTCWRHTSKRWNILALTADIRKYHQFANL
eukprot:750624-Pleurochrysis_carterae.AAC.1